jgi:hypothetical protein
MLERLVAGAVRYGHGLSVVHLAVAPEVDDPTLAARLGPPCPTPTRWCAGSPACSSRCCPTPAPTEVPVDRPRAEVTPDRTQGAPVIGTREWLSEGTSS